MNQRQQFINQSIQLSRVRDALVHDLAQVVISDKDEKVRDLLAQYGLTVHPAPSTATTAEPAASRGAPALTGGGTAAPTPATTGH
ncbi:MAG TPA: hypothetical protein VME47_13230 [Acetobacteraceae bacterium]|nr:hypothetical protein [Acetobacteraceae bacterium]